jgi:hypothetical protein
MFVRGQLLVLGLFGIVRWGWRGRVPTSFVPCGGIEFLVDLVDDESLSRKC